MALLLPTTNSLRNGYIAKTFSEAISEEYAERNLRRPVHGLESNVDSLSRSTPWTIDQLDAAPGYESTCVVLDYVPDYSHGIVLKQEQFIPYATTKRRNAELLRKPPTAPIFFVGRDKGPAGIALLDALQEKCQHIEGWNEKIPADYREKTTVWMHIRWAGYKPKQYQFQLRNEKKQEPGPITLQKLIRHVARGVKDFVEKHEEKAENQAYRYRIGDGDDKLQLEEIWLVGVVSTSGGTIMPLLQLGPRRPRPDGV